MTEVWKSTPKHWCTICKIFIDGKKSTINTHESSSRHKASQRNYAEEMRKKRQNSELGARELSAEMRAIEMAAASSFSKDVARGDAKQTINRTDWSQKGGGRSYGGRNGTEQAVPLDFVAFYNQQYGHGEGANMNTDVMAAIVQKMKEEPSNEPEKAKESHEEIVSKAVPLAPAVTVQVDEATGLGKWEKVTVVNTPSVQPVVHNNFPTKLGKNAVVLKSNIKKQSKKLEVSDDEKEEQDFMQKFGHSSLLRPETKDIDEPSLEIKSESAPVAFKKRKLASNVKVTTVGIE